jgi:type I restriction enzyme S subunit
VIALEHLAKSGGLDELCGGSTIKHLTRETFVKLVLPVPPTAEQSRIVAEVDRHLSITHEVESEVDANLQRAQALRQATLRSCFLGRFG